MPCVEPGHIERASAEVDDHDALAGLRGSDRAVGQMEGERSQRFFNRNSLTESRVAG